MSQLLPLDIDVIRSGQSEADPVAADIQNLDYNVAADVDALAILAGKNEHGIPLLEAVNPWGLDGNNGFT
jgi:hypothetical protein